MKKVSRFGWVVLCLFVIGVFSGYASLAPLWAASANDQPDVVAEQGTLRECLEVFLSDIERCLEVPAAVQLVCAINSVETVLDCLSGLESATLEER